MDSDMVYYSLKNKINKNPLILSALLEQIALSYEQYNKTSSRTIKMNSCIRESICNNVSSTHQTGCSTAEKEKRVRASRWSVW